MSNYLSNIKLKVPFDGEEVTVVVRQLEKADAIAATGFKGQEGEEAARVFVDGLFTKYFVSTTLTDADGNKIEREVLLRDVYFSNFVSAVIKGLMEASRPPVPPVPVSPAAEPSTGATSVAASAGEDSASSTGANSISDAPA